MYVHINTAAQKSIRALVNIIMPKRYNTETRLSSIIRLFSIIHVVLVKFETDLKMYYPLLNLQNFYRKRILFKRRQSISTVIRYIASYSFD